MRGLSWVRSCQQGVRDRTFDRHVVRQGCLCRWSPPLRVSEFSARATTISAALSLNPAVSWHVPQRLSVKRMVQVARARYGGFAQPRGMIGLMRKKVAPPQLVDIETGSPIGPAGERHVRFARMDENRVIRIDSDGAPFVNGSSPWLLKYTRPVRVDGVSTMLEDHGELRGTGGDVEIEKLRAKWNRRDRLVKVAWVIVGMWIAAAVVGGLYQSFSEPGGGGYRSPDTYPPAKCPGAPWADRDC